MTRYESLLVKAKHYGVDSVEMDFEKDCGYYVDNVAFINKTSTTACKHCILAEELGHHFTSAGNILDQNNPNNIKQEKKARAWGVEHAVPLSLLVEAIDYPCLTRLELAEYLEITEEYLVQAIEYYKQKYGTYVTIGDYTILFEPLKIIKMFNSNQQPG